MQRSKEVKESISIRKKLLQRPFRSEVDFCEWKRLCGEGDDLTTSRWCVMSSDWRAKDSRGALKRPRFWRSSRRILEGWREEGNLLLALQKDGSSSPSSRMSSTILLLEAVLARLWPKCALDAMKTPLCHLSAKNWAPFIDSVYPSRVHGRMFYRTSVSRTFIASWIRDIYTNSNACLLMIFQ